MVLVMVASFAVTVWAMQLRIARRDEALTQAYGSMALLASSLVALKDANAEKTRAYEQLLAATIEQEMQQAMRAGLTTVSALRVH
jgi:hypothetical protein